MRPQHPSRVLLEVGDSDLALPAVDRGEELLEADGPPVWQAQVAARGE